MITQKEIAKKLGISRTTVARAINGSENIKEETKQKILNLASEMGYQKNYIGSSLASKKKNIYAFIIKSKNSFYTEQIKKGIKKIRDEHKYYNFEIKEIYTDIDKPDDQVKELKRILLESEKISKRIDGILITPLNKKEIYSVLKPYLDKIKVVSMGIRLNSDILYVGPDYLKEGEIAASILSKVLRKNEKILIIDNGDDKISSNEYLKGFLTRIEKEEFDILGIFKKSGIEESIRFLNQFLKKEKVDAIYINRYVQDILKKLSPELLKDKKIIANGIGNGIKKLIEKKIIMTTVTDDSYETGYKAGKIIFDMLYKDKQKKSKRIITEDKIIFLENLK